MPVYVQDIPDRYTEFDLTYTSDTPRGTVSQKEDVYGFNYRAVTIAERTSYTFCYKCEQVVFDKKSATGEEILKGDYLYGDPSDDYKVSATKGAGYIYLGIAHQDATADATTVQGEFDGTMADLR